MSTGLNSLTGVIFQDLIKPVLKRDLSEATASRIMKMIAASIGVLCVGLVFLVEKLGALIQVSVILIHTFHFVEAECAQGASSDPNFMAIYLP